MLSHLYSKNNHKSGFTLIELLVVVAIIGLLSSIVLASLGTARQKARDAVTLQEVRQIQVALEIYYNEHGKYPNPDGDGMYCIGSNTCVIAGSLYTTNLGSVAFNNILKSVVAQSQPKRPWYLPALAHADVLDDLKFNVNTSLQNSGYGYSDIGDEQGTVYAIGGQNQTLKFLKAGAQVGQEYVPAGSSSGSESGSSSSDYGSSSSDYGSSSSGSYSDSGSSSSDSGYYGCGNYYYCSWQGETWQVYNCGYGWSDAGYCGYYNGSGSGS